ncbi:MAG: RnfABCDGE type electron transport complex subunit D, partial [Sedimentisphaerales bacterium]|nr:RnfABCDGE type electron transport complex subunit D [Sedimentisphaerales bacterium]
QSDRQVLLVSSSPHLQDESTSRRVMLEVAIGTLPATVMAVYLYRVSALVVLLSCVIAGIGTEWIFNAVRKKTQTILDGSALVTCLILALSLPPTFPWWGCVIGSVVAIGVAKMLFGGLGANIFNPAMVGRAFLMACFGMLMTTWTPPATQRSEPAEATGQPAVQVDAVTEPTPLALAKQAIKARGTLETMKRQIDELESLNNAAPQLAAARRDYQETLTAQEKRLGGLNADRQAMFLGTISGSAGETSALCWLVGGLFLLLRRTITYHIPLAVLASALAIATFAWLLNGDVYPHPLVHLFGGGLMMGAFFIATDPVSCPLSTSGRVIFGIGVGVLIMLIRLLGGYPEGVMYAILLLNAMTPLLDRWTRPTPLGGHAKKG